MKEILFRGKRLDNGNWVEGYYAKTSDMFTGETYDIIFRGDVVACLDIDKFDGYRVVRPETVGQFTGLTDKNGKKIFEGDVVNVSEHIPAVNGLYQVVYSEANHAYTLQRSIEYYYDHFLFSELNGFAKTSEVIGNIHDNPELLEVR